MIKVLWIVNLPLGAIQEKLTGKRSDGLWMGALLRDFENREDVSLVVATTYRINKTIKVEENGVVYYALSNEYPLLYNENDKNNVREWKQLLEEAKPDIIQVWGTEFSHGLCALRIAEKMGIPSVIYMQGLLASIAKHYLAGIAPREIRKNITFRDFIKRGDILRQQKRYYERSKKESEMFSLSRNIISENDWCDRFVLSIEPKVKSYHCPLSINRVFKEKQWDIKEAQPHSIICTASGYPLKGLHMTLKAVAKLKEKYNDVTLYVPGDKQVSDGSIRGLIRKNGYVKYIEKLIKKLGIEENVVWLGVCDQSTLADYYKKTRVFVLSSAIENHSSSLKEAMLVGTPCVSSIVGGIPEYLTHNQNGFLYRFSEYELMASYIDQLFCDDELAKKFSSLGREKMQSLHMDDDTASKIIQIYEQILGDK